MQRDERYGLVADRSRPDRRATDARQGLGPRPELVRAAEERKEAAAPKRPLKRGPLTDEERERRLREMEADALKHEQMRVSRLHKMAEKVGEGQPGADVAGNGSGSTDPKFLREMARTVYTEGGDMAERIQRNRHYHQSKADMESGEGFIAP